MNVRWVRAPQAAVAASHDKRAVPASFGGYGVLAQHPAMAHNLQAWLLLAGHTLRATQVGPRAGMR